MKISRAGLWLVWVLWPLCRGGCNVPRASNAHPYKASNKIYALFLAIRLNRFRCKLRSAGAACGVDVGGELSACAVHLAELGENLLCAGVVVLGDESLQLGGLRLHGGVVDGQVLQCAEPGGQRHQLIVYIAALLHRAFGGVLLKLAVGGGVAPRFLGAAGVLFFVLVLFAAVTSSIALTESAVSTFEDELGWDRKKATVLVGVIMVALGTLSSLGYGPLAGVTVIGMQFLDFFDFLTNSVMMPIAAIATCLLVSRVIDVDKIEQEVELDGQPFRRKRIFRFMIRWLCPVFAAVILASSVANAFGIIKM